MELIGEEKKDLAEDYFSKKYFSKEIFSEAFEKESSDGTIFFFDRVFRRHHVVSNPVNYVDSEGTGPLAGTACFAALPIVDMTLPGLMYDLAGSAFDTFSGDGSGAGGSGGSGSGSSGNNGAGGARCEGDSASTSTAKKVGRFAFQTTAATVTRLAIQRYGPAACVALFAAPGP